MFDEPKEEEKVEGTPETPSTPEGEEVPT